MLGVRWFAAYLVRKRCGAILLATIGLAFFTALLFAVNMAEQPRALLMEQRLEEMRTRMRFMESLYRARQEDLFALEGRVLLSANVNASQELRPTVVVAPSIVGGKATLPPEVNSMLKNISGTRAATGFNVSGRSTLRIPLFAYQLLPHLLLNSNSVRPMYNMRGSRAFLDVVIGLPTVRRDKESYLMITLTQLVEGLSAEDETSTLIVVYVGETDPEYVLQTARQIESLFPHQVESGLIEVVAPSASFYPDLDGLEPTLGDPVKRFKWRTKQNLDNIYLMSYCRPRGTYYLMLEDDIVAKKNYMQEIKKFAVAQSVSSPNWIVLEFCRVGGIGKLLKSADLIQFITYVELFYTNLPIDWLIESFLADKVCTIEKSSKQCQKSKLAVRPRYDTSLFQHIGLYSSLKGKIQKLKDTHYGTVPQYFPHNNPPLASVRADIAAYNDHTLLKAYDGKTFFWGLKPKKGDILEFAFISPIYIERYLFRSGNAEHVSDKLYDTSVCVRTALAATAQQSDGCVVVGACDDFGYCEGHVDVKLGKIAAIRLTVHSNSSFWVIISEILITTVREKFVTKLSDDQR